MPLGDGTGWDTTAPADADQRSVGAQEIRDLRTGVGIRTDKEHTALASSSAGGEHKKGAARAYYVASAVTVPTTQPDGSTALTQAADEGRLAMLDKTLYHYSDETGGTNSPWRYLTPKIGSFALADASGVYNTTPEVVGFPFRLILWTTSDGFQGNIITAGYSQTNVVDNVAAAQNQASGVSFQFRFNQDDYNGASDGVYKFEVQKNYVSSTATFFYAILG